SDERTPIIALTAHAIQGYREKCLENDMDDYVTKPLRKQVLLQTIESWIDPRPTILVVDDSKDNRSLVLNHLKREECRLIEAAHGEEAIALFQRRRVSLILMDMEMPILDGYTATRAIRDLKSGSAVPIIALTAHRDKKYIDKALDAGCTDYLTKPLRKKQLLECITRHLPEKKVTIIDTALAVDALAVETRSVTNK
ncbi:MAG: response regulator, partial [bacterium]